MIGEFLTGSAVGRAFTFGIIALIIYTPYCLSIGVDKMTYGKNVPASKMWQSFIPFWNIIKADIGYFGKPGFASFAQLGLLGFVLRIIAVFVSTSSPTLYYVTFGLMVVGVIVYYISGVYTSFTIINDSQVMKPFTAVLLSIIFPFGYMYIGNILAAEINRRQSTMATKRGF